MANMTRTCSLSQQNCAALYPFLGSAIPFTSSSCVPYTPWVSGDTGICGWVGAPCTPLGTGSNCSAFRLSSEMSGTLTSASQICVERAPAWVVCVGQYQEKPSLEVRSSLYSAGLGDPCPDNAQLRDECNGGCLSACFYV